MCFQSLDLRLRFLTALTFVVLVIRCVLNENPKPKRGNFVCVFYLIYVRVWYGPLWLIWSCRSCCSFFSSMVILYLRFGAKALQDNFVAELSTHYQNYILSNNISFRPWFHLNTYHVRCHVYVLNSEKWFLNSRHTSWIFILLWPTQLLPVHIGICVFPLQKCTFW